MQWGTVRMLGTFLTEDPLDVPGKVLAFVAEQLDVDPACASEHLTRPKTLLADVLAFVLHASDGS